MNIWIQNFNSATNGQPNKPLRSNRRRDRRENIAYRLDTGMMITNRRSQHLTLLTAKLLKPIQTLTTTGNRNRNRGNQDVNTVTQQSTAIMAMHRLKPTLTGPTGSTWTLTQNPTEKANRKLKFDRGHHGRRENIVCQLVTVTKQQTANRYEAQQDRCEWALGRPIPLTMRRSVESNRKIEPK